MNNVLTGRFDAVGTGWGITLVLLAILFVVSVLVLKRVLRQPNESSDMPTSLPRRWHAEDSITVLELLDTNLHGLSNTVAADRLMQYGPNQLPEPMARGAWRRFFFQFHNVLIYVLIVAGVVTAMLGHWVDACVILGVVVINAVIGFMQEGKAENALKAIRQMLSLNAMVLREGKQVTVPAETLVPGDIVLLQSGDKVPADLRLFRVKGLQVQESVLTGESIPVEKTTDPVLLEAVLGDRRCLAYSGTLVTHGQGTGVVVETGARTGNWSH
ncbi:HAD-IC family P-type ATPase [Vibrio sp. PP-XX7]